MLKNILLYHTKQTGLQQIQEIAFQLLFLGNLGGWFWVDFSYIK